MKLRIRYENVAGRIETVTAPYAVAWALARALAVHIKDSVSLVGRLGTAKVTQYGDGSVHWNEPHAVTLFDEHTDVCIS